MNRFAFAAAFILIISSFMFGQWNRSELERIQKIKLLEASRSDVRASLAEYEASDDEGYFQNFSNDDLDIEVAYASGKCAEDPEDTDASSLWKIAEWKVTNIEITFYDAVKLEDIGLDTSNFTKEQTDEDDPESYILYSRKLGIALEVDEDGVERILIFPPKSQSKRLCSASIEAKEFYVKDGSSIQRVFARRTIGCVNSPADVKNLILGSYEIRPTDSKSISIETVAHDPENDVLTYRYNVTAGQIRGTGAKVVWDLTAVSPGTYSITASVDDGCGFCGMTMTRSVTVK